MLKPWNMREHLHRGQVHLFRWRAGWYKDISDKDSKKHSRGKMGKKSQETRSSKDLRRASVYRKPPEIGEGIKDGLSCTQVSTNYQEIAPNWGEREGLLMVFLGPNSVVFLKWVHCGFYEDGSAPRGVSAPHFMFPLFKSPGKPRAAPAWKECPVPRRRAKQSPSYRLWLTAGSPVEAHTSAGQTRGLVQSPGEQWHQALRFHMKIWDVTSTHST